MSTVLSKSVAPAASHSRPNARSGGKARRPAAPATAVAAPLAGVPITVALSALEPSPRNVRRAAAVGIEELAALIDSQGLLQPLCVTRIGDPSDAADSTDPRFAVEAGGRRLLALRWLAERGRLSVDAPVECRLIDVSRAHEVSLAENSARQDMHPADQFDAFRALVEAGRSVDEVAHRFGVSVLTVQRRLRLANVAPELVALYRAGEATLDQMQALAIISDVEHQRAVWDSLDTWSRQPWQLRRRLLGEEVPVDDARVRFVGLGVYEAAGGLVRRDLFSEQGDAFVTDPVLLQRLVSQRLHAEADAVLAEGWAWAEPKLRFDYAERANYRPLANVRRAPTDDEARLLAVHREALMRNEAAIEQLRKTDNPGDSNDEAIEALEQASDRIGEEIEAIEAATLDWPEDARGRAGAVVTLDRGRLVVHRGLVRAEEGDDEPQISPDAPVAQASPPRPEFSDRLMLSMTAHRTAALQAAMIDAPHIALAALAHRLVLAVRAPYRSPSPLRVELHASRDSLIRHAPEIEGSRAIEQVERERQRLGDMLPGEPGDLLRWLISQPLDTLVALLALCAAESVDVTHGNASRTQDGSDQLAEALSLDMADWWEPTVETYLEAVPKAKIVAAVEEALGASAARDLVTMKKAEAVRAAAGLLAGSRWLPGPLRSRADDGVSAD
jgi:ParB family chromosome partitioning protein